MKQNHRFKLSLILLCMMVLLYPTYPDRMVSAASKKHTETIQINCKKQTLYIDDTIQLNLIGISTPTAWTSSNSSVASVDKHGVVTAKKAGSANITATYQKKDYVCKVKVLPKHIIVNSTSFSLNAATKLMVEIHDMKAGESITAKVEHESILSCEWNGSFNSRGINTLVLTPKANGVTTITLTSSESDQIVTITVCVSGCKKTGNKTVSPRNKKLSPEALYKLCSKSVVELTTDVSVGSGFFLDASTIVTNYHVIEGASWIKAKMYNEKTYNVIHVVGYDKDRDLALLSVKGSFTPLPLNTHGVTTGETVYTIGSPLGFTGTFSNGMVTYHQRYMDGAYYIQTNAAFSSGNSGGPLLNVYGEVIGINTMSNMMGQNMNFSIDAAQILAIDRSRPLSVKEFLKEHPVPIYVDEDVEKSGSMETAQIIEESNILVGSTGGELNFKDYYKIEITQAGTYALDLYTESGSGAELAKLWIGIIDEKGTILDHITAVNTDFLSEADLTPGTYYILVYPNSKNYHGEDFNYFFKYFTSNGVG